MSTYSQLISYYESLLVAQYNGLPNASATIAQLCSGILMPDGNEGTLPLDVLNGFNLNATIQTISFSSTPSSGSFTIVYNGNASAPIPWNVTSDGLLAIVNGLFGAGTVTPLGSPSAGPIVLNFNTIISPLIISIGSNTTGVNISVSTNLAVGQQLDWLGLYNGVTRSGIGANGQYIVLNDQDFFTLILIAIARNHLGSDLSSIQKFIHQFFNNIILVFDYADTAPMQMSYLINTSSLSNNLVQLVIAQNLLPVPMAVSVSYVGAPTIIYFFAFTDYFINAGAQQANTTPFNNFGGYSSAFTNASYIWMDYANSL